MLSALSFLTVIPASIVPGSGKRSPSQREISNSRAYYPAVGLLLGLMLLGLERGCREVFPDFLSAAVLLVSLVAVTRGLHLDGLMDTCDGIFGGFNPARRLEIMRDSQVGAFGIAGAASLLLLKYGALVSLLGLDNAGKEWALLLFPMLSRWSMVVALAAFPYARSQGLGSPFHQGITWWPTLVAGGGAAVAAVLLGGIGGAGMLAGASAMAWLLGWAMAGRLGGLTGDTYGAINEVVETAGLLAVVAIMPHGWIEPLTSLFDLT